MKKFFKGLLRVILGGSFGKETVIDVLTEYGQRRAKWGVVPFGVVLFLGLGLSLIGVGVLDVVASEWNIQT